MAKIDRVVLIDSKTGCVLGTAPWSMVDKLSMDDLVRLDNGYGIRVSETTSLFHYTRSEPMSAEEERIQRAFS